MSRDYVSRGIVNTCQRDPDMPYRADTPDMGVVGSWTRGANKIMVSSVSDMLASLSSMNLNQILSAGENNDIPGDTNQRL